MSEDDAALFLFNQMKPHSGVLILTKNETFGDHRITLVEYEGNDRVGIKELALSLENRETMVRDIKKLQKENKVPRFLF